MSLRILRAGPTSLWTPGQVKPNGVPRIDWTHPLSRGLIAYYWALPPSTYADLVSGQIAANVPATAPTHVVSKYGVGVGHTAVNDSVVSGTPATIVNPPNVQSFTAPFSFAGGWWQVGAFTVGADANNNWVGIQANSTNGPYFGAGSTSEFQYFSSTADSGITSATIPGANNFYIALGVAASSSASTLYLNGVSIGTSSTATNNSTNTGQWWQFGQLDPNGGNPNAHVFFGALWNRALTAQEALQLYLDSYCFLIPPEAEMPAISVISSGAFSMSAQTGFFSLTDEQQTLKKTSINYAQMTPFALSDKNETLIKGSRSSLYVGDYNLTDEQIALTKASIDYPQSASFALTPENETLKKTSALNAQMTPFSLTDESEKLLKGSAASIQAGFYSLTGEQVTLKKTSLLAVQAGYYTLTGETLSLTATGIGAFTMSLGTGTYSLTDESLTLLKKSEGYIQAGYYSLTDEALALLKGSKLSSSTGTYTLTDEALTLKAGHLAGVQAGYYALTGESLSLSIPGAFVMSIGAGTYALTPESLMALKKSKMGMQSGTYAFTVENEQALRGHLAAIQAGTYALTSEQLRELVTHLADLQSGYYVVTVENVTLTATGQIVLSYTATPALLGNEVAPMLTGEETASQLLGNEVTTNVQGKLG